MFSSSPIGYSNIAAASEIAYCYRYYVWCETYFATIKKSNVL